MNLKFTMKIIVILAVVAVCVANANPDSGFDPIEIGQNAVQGGIRLAGDIFDGIFGGHGGNDGGGRAKGGVKGGAKGGAKGELNITIVINLIQKLQRAVDSGNMVVVVKIVQQVLPKVNVQNKLRFPSLNLTKFPLTLCSYSCSN